MKPYEFVTLWRVEAPIDSVWHEICHATAWPAWWRGVERAVVVREGGESGVGAVYRYTWKSRLPYRLTFDMRVVRVEPPRVLEGIASGEVVGRGRWRLSPEGDATLVRYDWQVRTAKRWMTLLAPIARPVFKWNHDVIMAWGAEGLGKRLGVGVIERQAP